MVIQVLKNQSQPALLRQTGIGVCAWGVSSRLGGDTSTGRDLTPHWQLNNPLRKNTLRTSSPNMKS